MSIYTFIAELQPVALGSRFDFLEKLKQFALSAYSITKIFHCPKKIVIFWMSQDFVMD